MTSENTMGKVVGRAMKRFPPVKAAMENAFRVEDWLHGVRVRAVRRRGYRMIVEPYTSYGSTEWVRVLARVQMAPPEPSLGLGGGRRRKRPKKDRTVRGWRSFTRIAAGHVAATVVIDGERHRVVSDRGGIIDVNLPAKLEAGWRTITLESADGFSTEAPVFIVADDQEVGIVSDIDDTVMVTALPRPLLAAWNTFVLDEHARTPTPGMNVFNERLLEHFGHSGTPFIYLSTGPWNVAPTLARFLGRNLYPAGPLLLTDWGPTPDRFFRSGHDHKVKNLERLAQEFPRIKWILIGDDGQHDPEIYGDFARSHPERVRAIAIRNLSPGEAILAGGAKSLLADDGSPATPPAPWYEAPDGAGLVDAFQDAGVIEENPALRAAEDLREEFLAEMLAREGTYDPDSLR